MLETARVVVGPDEPGDGQSRAEAESQYWEYIADLLRVQGIEVRQVDLAAVPHDVVLTDAVRANIRAYSSR